MADLEELCRDLEPICKFSSFTDILLLFYRFSIVKVSNTPIFDYFFQMILVSIRFQI